MSQCFIVMLILLTHNSHVYRIWCNKNKAPEDKCNIWAPQGLYKRNQMSTLLTDAYSFITWRENFYAGCHFAACAYIYIESQITCELGTIIVKMTASNLSDTSCEHCVWNVYFSLETLLVRRKFESFKSKVSLGPHSRSTRSNTQKCTWYSSYSIIKTWYISCCRGNICIYMYKQWQQQLAVALTAGIHCV